MSFREALYKSFAFQTTVSAIYQVRICNMNGPDQFVRCIYPTGDTLLHGSFCLGDCTPVTFLFTIQSRKIPPGVVDLGLPLQILEELSFTAGFGRIMKIDSSEVQLPHARRSSRNPVLAYRLPTVRGIGPWACLGTLLTSIPAGILLIFSAGKSRVLVKIAASCPECCNRHYFNFPSKKPVIFPRCGQPGVHWQW